MKHRNRHVGAVWAALLLLAAACGDTAAEDTAPADEDGPETGEQPDDPMRDDPDDGDPGSADDLRDRLAAVPAAAAAQRQAVVLTVSEARAAQMAEAIYAAVDDQVAGVPSVDAATLSGRLDEWRCDHAWAVDSIEQHSSTVQVDAMEALPAGTDVDDLLVVLREGPWAESSTLAARDNLLRDRAECLADHYSRQDVTIVAATTIFDYPILTQPAPQAAKTDIDRIDDVFASVYEATAAALRSPALLETMMDSMMASVLPDDATEQDMDVMREVLSAQYELTDLAGFMSLYGDVVDCTSALIGVLLEDYLSAAQADRVRRLPEGFLGSDDMAVGDVASWLLVGTDEIDKPTAMAWLIELGPWQDGIYGLFGDPADREPALDSGTCEMILLSHPLGGGGF